MFMYIVLFEFRIVLSSLTCCKIVNAVGHCYRNSECNYWVELYAENYEKMYYSYASSVHMYIYMYFNSKESLICEITLFRPGTNATDIGK